MLSSLTNRIFLASTLLATVLIGFAVYFVSSRLRSEAEAELQRDLREAASLVDQQRATLFDTFTRTARLIADLPKFKAVVETHDPPTVAPIALDYQQQAGADLFLVTDPAGRCARLRRWLAGARQPAGSRPRASPSARRQGDADVLAAPTGVLQVVSVPITIGLSGRRCSAR